MNKGVDFVQSSNVYNNNWAVIDLNKMVRLAIRAQKEKIMKAGLKVTFDKLPVIHANTFLIRLLFHNLFNNALHFRQNDVIPIVTILYSQLKGKYIDYRSAKPGTYYHIISIYSNGIGFNRVASGSKFDVFYGIAPGIDFTGAGLGLEVCERIMNLHRGFITAEREGEGSVFNCFFPID